MTSEIAPERAPERAFVLQLSATRRGARLARLLAVEHVRAWGLPTCLEATAQIVAELATNAVTHGLVPGRDFRMTLSVTGHVLRIEVTDARHEHVPSVTPRGVLAAQDAGSGEGGRGLFLVEAFADRWGVTHGAEANGGASPSSQPYKTVWAEISVPGGG
ncbi:ATP-binding protein [Streptomyces sp. NBC_01497]|uniref:ATP-binding protein n=1 Tax=Streptomyces sp. NBC_01497 TaxID=2903885 RepID=UPI003FCD4253